MSLWASLKKKLTGEERVRAPDYSGFDDARLVELWAERDTLTEEARPLLEAQMDARGLAKQKPKSTAVREEPVLLRDDEARPRKKKARAPAARSLTVDGTTIDLTRAPFAEVASLLKVQLFSATGRTAYVTAVDRDAMVMHELASGLFMVLVYDLGGSELTVSRSESELWGMKDEALFGAALANLAAAPVHVRTLEHGIGLVFGNGSFVSPLALIVDGLAEAAGLRSADGYVVGVPNWHALVFAPLPVSPETMASLTALNAKLFDYVDAVSGELYRVETRASGELPRWPVAQATL